VDTLAELTGDYEQLELEVQRTADGGAEMPSCFTDLGARQ
jgi:hypothetical protein